MKKKEVKVKIFILENNMGFQNSKTREKSSMLIMKSDTESQNWYYEIGAEDKIPEDLETFKDMFIDFCCEENIGAEKKFKEESWLNI